MPPALFVAWLLAVWPPPLWYRTHWPAETAFMRMRRADDTAARRAARAARPACRLAGGDACRLYRPVPLDSIAPALAVAAVTGEDNNFWTHGGLDYLAILRALGYRRAAFSWNEPRDRAEMRRALGRAWERRDELRGASTITQQLAKNLYLSPSRNPLRKVKEAVTAYRLEAALGKRRIMELYLNVAEMGDEIWGAEAASQAYFRKPAAKLTRSEAAALAGLLPFPLRSNPALKPGRMRWRQQLILRRMGGERIEVPKEAADDAAPPPPEPADLPAPDTSAAPAESLPPVADTAPDAVTPDPVPPDSVPQ